MGLIIILALVIWFFSYMIKKRNEFKKLETAVKRSTSEISVQIEKRSACLNDALSIAKKNYEHEVAGIENLTQDKQLEQLSMLGNMYPELGAMQGYNQMVGEALELNKDIAAQRTIVNGNIEVYNEAITEFPALIIAAMLKYKTIKFIDEDNMESGKILNKKEVDISNF